MLDERCSGDLGKECPCRKRDEGIGRRLVGLVAFHHLEAIRVAWLLPEWNELSHNSDVVVRIDVQIKLLVLKMTRDKRTIEGDTYMVLTYRRKQQEYATVHKYRDWYMHVLNSRDMV